MFTRCKAAKFTISACLCLIFALSPTSFAQANADPPKVLRKRVGVLLLRQADPFFLRLATALREKSVEKLDLEIVDAESSLTDSSQDLISQRTAQQEVQLHRFIMEGVDALIVFPASDRLGFYTQTAKRAGIPIFTLDACKSCGDSIVANITSNNKKGGTLAAKLLTRRLLPTSEIVVLTAPGYATVEDRIAGFDDYIRTKKTVTVWKYPVDGRRETAAEQIRKALNEHPHATGVFAINDDTALGALEGMQGRSDLKLVGFDGSREARQAIDKGSPFCATIVQDTDLLASTLIQQIRHYDSKSSREKTRPIPVKLYPNRNVACR